MQISFEQAKAEDQKIFITLLETGKVFEGYFTDLRVDRKTVPSPWHAYDLRDGETGEFATIEHGVLVNHGGTILMPEELPIPKYGLELLSINEDNKDTAQADYSFV